MGGGRGAGEGGLGGGYSRHGDGGGRGGGGGGSALPAPVGGPRRPVGQRISRRGAGVAIVFVGLAALRFFLLSVKMMRNELCQLQT